MRQTGSRVLLKFTCLVFIALGLLTLTGPVVAGKGPVATQAALEAAGPGKIPGLAGLHNFGVVEKGVYRGAQPTAEGYATLKRMGVKSVLNLRNDRDEKSAVEAAGMKALVVPMGTVRRANRENVDKAVKVIADPANRPIFVHCMWGQDRTGVVIAAYRMEVDGWALPDAEREMQSYGFNEVWVNLKHLIHKIAADIGKAR